MNIKILLVILGGLSFFSLSFSDTNGIWTYPEDIKAGIFGADETIVGDNYTFDNIVYFNKNIFADSLVSNTNPSYILNLSGVSNLNRIVADMYFSPSTNSYFLNPAGFSKLKELEVDTNLSYKGVELDSRYINEGQTNSINSNMVIDGSLTRNDLNLGDVDNRYATKTYVNSQISTSGGMQCTTKTGPTITVSYSGGTSSVSCGSSGIVMRAWCEKEESTFTWLTFTTSTYTTYASPALTGPSTSYSCTDSSGMWGSLKLTPKVMCCK